MGRINRVMYWTFLAVAIILLAAIWWFLSWRPPLTVVVTLLCVARLHDIGRSGWFALGMFIPGVPIEAQVFPTRTGPFVAPTIGVTVMIVALVGIVVWLGTIRGQPGANRFGPPLPGLGGEPVEVGR
jgi:uncharacterized membrane protein YhaH (DUF805 family)